MNTIEIILSIFSGLGLTGTTLLGLFIHRTTNKRLAVAEADKAEAQANNEEWELERKRLEESHQIISTLNGIIKTQGETISMNNKALDDKTARIRETQDEKDRFAHENSQLIREIGDLKLRLQKHECIKLSCIHRDPPNEYTNAARQKEASKSKTQQK